MEPGRADACLRRCGVGDGAEDLIGRLHTHLGLESPDDEFAYRYRPTFMEERAHA